MSVASRQIRFVDGRCAHEATEEVRSFGGDVIAIRCTLCTHIVCHVGTCDGCGLKDWHLHYHLATKQQRYCSEECYRKTQARIQAEKKAAAK